MAKLKLNVTHDVSFHSAYFLSYMSDVRGLLFITFVD